MFSWIVAILLLSLPLTSQFLKLKEDLPDKNKNMYLLQDVSGHNKIPRKALFLSLDDIDNRINENYSVINVHHKDKFTDNHQDDSATGFIGDFIGEQTDYRYVINGAAVQSNYLNKPTSLENYLDRSNSLLSYRNTADDYDKIVFPLHYEGVSDKMTPVNRRIYASGSFENFGNKIDLKEKIKELADNNTIDRLASSKTNYTNLNKINIHCNNTSLGEEKPILNLCDGINSSSRNSIDLNKKKSILRPANPNEKPIIKTTNNKSYIIETDKERTSELRYTFKVAQRNNTAMNKNQEVSTSNILENIVKVSHKNNLTMNEIKPISNYIDKSAIRINKEEPISSYKDSSDILQDLEEYDMIPNKELTVSSPTNINGILNTSNNNGLISNNDSIILNMNNSNYLLTRYYPNSRHYNTTQPSTDGSFVDINKASSFHKYGGTTLTIYSISDYSTIELEQNTTPRSLSKHYINTVPSSTLNNYFDIKNKNLDSIFLNPSDKNKIEASYRNNSNLTGRNDKDQAKIPNNMVLSSNIRLLNLVDTNNTSLNKWQYNISNLIKQDIKHNENNKRIVSIDLGKHGFDMQVPNKIKTPVKGLSDFTDKISDKERTSLFSNLWNLDKQIEIKTINETENSHNSFDKNNYLSVQLENLYAPQIIEKDVNQFNEKMDIHGEKSENLNRTIRNITFSLNDESKTFLELNKDLENVSSPIQSPKVKILNSYLTNLNNSKVTTNKFSKQETLNLVPLTLKNSAFTTLVPNNFMVVTHNGNERNVATAAFGDILNKISISGILSKFKNISNVISKKVHATTTQIALKDSKPIELDSEGNNINTLIVTNKMKPYEKDNIKGKYNITSESLGSQKNIYLKQILNLNQVSNSVHETTSFASATKMNFSLIKTPIINSSVVNISRNPNIERLIKLPGIYINNLNIFFMDSKENIPQSKIIKVSAIPKKYPQDIKNRNFLVYKTNMTSVTPKGNHGESNVLSSSSTLQRKITFVIQFPEIIVSKLNETGPFEISLRNQSLHDKYEDDEMTMIKPPIMGSAPLYSLADSKVYSNTKTHENHQKNRINKKMHLTNIEKEMDTPHKSLPREKNEDHITNVLQLQLPLVVDSNSKQGYQIQLSDEIKVDDQDYFKPKHKKQHLSEILEKPPLASQQNFEKRRGFNEKNIHSKPKKLLDTYPMVVNSKMTLSFVPITMSYNSKIIKPKSRLREANIPMSHKNKYKFKLIQSDDLLNTRHHHRKKRNIANNLFQHLKNKLNLTDLQDFPKDYDSEKMSSKINGQTTMEGKGTSPNDFTYPFSNIESNKVIQDEYITFSNILEHVYPTPIDIRRKNRRYFSRNKRGKYGEINKSDQENEKPNSSETRNNSSFLGDRFLHNKDSYNNSNLFSVLKNANKNRLRVSRKSFSPIKINPMHDKVIADILHIEQITHAYKNRKNSDIKSFKVNVSPTKQLPTVNFISGHRTLAACTESNTSLNVNICDYIVDNNLDFKGDNETKGTLSNDSLIDTTVNINYDNDNDNIRNIQSPREQQSTYYNNDNDNYSYYNSKNESSEVEDNYLAGSNLVSHDNEFKKNIFYLIYLPVPIAYNKQRFLEFSNVSGKNSPYVEFQIIPMIGTLTLSKINTLLPSNNLTNNYNSSAIISEIVTEGITSTNNYTVHPNKFKNKVNNVYFRERNTTLHSPKIFETMINANNITIDSPYNLFRVGNRYSFDKLPNPEIIEVIQGYNNFHEVQIQNFPNLLVLNTHTNKDNSSLLSNGDLERPKSVQIHKYTGRTNVSEEHDPAKQVPKMFNSSFNAVKDENNVNIFKNHEAPNSSLFFDTNSRKVNSNLSKKINKISKDRAQEILKFTNSTGNVASIIIKSNTNTIRNSTLSSNSRKILNKKTNSNNNTNYWDILFRNIQNTYSGIVSKIINITIQDDIYIKPSSNNNSNKLTNVSHITSKDTACKNQSLCDEKINITKPFYSVEYNSSLLSPFESTPNTLFPNIWTDKTYANITNINNRFAKSKTAKTLHSEITESMLMSSIHREMSTTLSSNVFIDLAKEYYNSYLNSKDITTTKNLKYKSNQFFENSSNEEDSHEASFLFSSTTFPSRKFFDSLSTSQLSLTSQPFKFKHPIEHPSLKIPADNNSLGQQININVFSQNNLGQQTFSTEVSIFQTKYDGLKSFLSTKNRKSSKYQNTGESFLNGIKENLRTESVSFKQANSSNVTRNRTLVKSIIYKEEPEKFTLSSNLLGSDYSQISNDHANKNVLLNHSLKPVKSYSSTDKSNSEALTNQYQKITNMFSEMYQIKQIQRNETSLIYSKFNNLFYPTEKYNANIFGTRNVVNSSEQHLNIITKYDSRSESKSTNKLYGSSNNMFSFMNNMKNYQEYHYTSSHHFETNAEKLNKQYVVLQTTEINSMLNMFETADKITTPERQVKIIDSHAEQNKINKGTEMSSTFYNEDKIKGNLFDNSKQFIHLPHNYNPFASVSPTTEITQTLNSTINYWKNITSEQKVGSTKIDEDLYFGDTHNMHNQDSKLGKEYGETKCMYEIETSKLSTSNQLEKYVNMDANKDKSNIPYLQKTNRENTSSSHLIKIDDIVETNYLDNSTTNSSTLFQFISDTDEIENKEIATPQLNLNLNITFQTKNQITSKTSYDRLDDVKITLVNTDVPILNSTSNVDFNLNNTIIYTFDPDAIFNKTVNHLMKQNNESNIFVDKYINYSDPDEIKSKNDISINNNLTPHYKINSTIMEKNYKVHDLLNYLIPFNSSAQISYLNNNNKDNKTDSTNKTSSTPKSLSNSEGSLSLTVHGLEYNTKPGDIFKANYNSLKSTSLNKGNFMISNPLSLMDMTNYTEHIYPSNIHRDIPEKNNYTDTNYMASEVNQFIGHNKSIINLKTSNHNNDYYKENHTNLPIVNNNKDLNKIFIHLDSTTNENTTQEQLFDTFIDLLTGGEEGISQTTSTPEDDNIFNNIIFFKSNKTQIHANNNNNQTQTMLFVNEANANPDKNSSENGNAYFGGIYYNINKTKLDATNYNMAVAVVDATSVLTHNKYFNGTFNEITQLEMNSNDTRLMKINNNTNTLLSRNKVCASEINKNNLNNNYKFNLELLNNITHSEKLISCVKDENNNPKTSSESKNILNSFISQQVDKKNEIINDSNTESVLSENKVILVPFFSANEVDQIHDKGKYFEINKTNPELNNNYSDPMIFGMEKNKLSQTHRPTFDLYNNGIGYETNTTKVHINNNSSYSNFSEDDGHLFMTPFSNEINNSINVTNIIIKNNYNETVLPDLGINMVPLLSGIEPEITFNNAKYQEYNSTIVQKPKNHHNPVLTDSESNTVYLVSEPEDKHSTVIIHEDTDIKEQISKTLNNSYIYNVNINLLPTISTLKIENIVNTGIPNQFNEQNIYINSDSNNPLLLLDKVTKDSSIFDLEPDNINNYFLSQNVSITNQQMNSNNNDVKDNLNLALLLSTPGPEFINNNVISSEVNKITLPTTKNYNDSIYDAEINISLIAKVTDTKTQMNNTFNNVLINVTKIDSIPNMSTLIIDNLYNEDINNEDNKKELPTIISYTKPLASNTEVNLVSSITNLEHKHIKNIIPQNVNVSYVKINSSYTNSILFDDEVNLIPTLSAPVLDIIYNNNISYEINKTKVENTNIHTDTLTSGAELNMASSTFRPDHDKIHINDINSETNTVQIQLNSESNVPIFNNYGKVNLPPAKSDINTDEIQTNIIFNEVDSKMVQANNSQTKSPIYYVKINTSFSLYPFEPKTINDNVISKIINTTKIQNKINNNTSAFVYDSVVDVVKTNSDLHLKNMTINLSNFSSDPKFDLIPIKDNSFDVNKTKLLFVNNYTDPMISGSDVNSIIPTYRPSNDNMLIDGIGFEINITKEQINNNNTHVLNFNGGDNNTLISSVIIEPKNMYINSIANKANVNTTYNTNLLNSILIHNNANLVPLSPPSSYIVFNNSISNEIDRSKVQNNKNNYSDTLIFAVEVNTIFPTYNPNHYNKKNNNSINEIKPTKEQINISENLKNNYFEVNLLPLMSAHENETKHFDRISNGIIVANGHNITNTYAHSLLSVAHVNTNIATSTSDLKHGHSNINSIFQENNGTKLQIKTNPTDPLLSNADVNIKPPISALKTEDGFNTTKIRKNVKLTDPLISEGKVNLIPSRSKLKYDEIFINATSQKGNSTKGETKPSFSLANAGPHLIPNKSILKPNPLDNKNISYIIKPTKVDINSIFNYSSLSEVPDYVVTTIYPNKYINNNLNNISFNMNRTRLQRDKHFTNTFLNVVGNHTPIISSINQPNKLHPSNIYNELKNIVTPDNIDFVTTISPYFTNAEYLEPINLSFYNSTLLYPVSDLNVLNIRNPNKTLSFSHDTFDSIFADPLISTSVNVNLSLKPQDDFKILPKVGSQTESVNDTLHYSFDNTVDMDSVTNHVMFPFINVSDYSSTDILNNTYDKSNYDHGQITSPSNILTSSFAVKDPNLDHKDFNVFSNTKGNELFPLYTKTNATGILNQPNISSNAVIEKPHAMGDLVPNLSYRYNNTNSMNYVTTNNIFPNINLSDLNLTDTIYHSNNILKYNIGQIPTQRNPFNSSISIIDPNFHHKDFKDSSNPTGMETWPFDTRTDAIKTLDQPNISVNVIVEKPHVMSDLDDTLYNYNNTSYMLNYVTTNRIFPSINHSGLHLTNSIYNTNNVSNYDIRKIPTPSNQFSSSFSDMDPNFHINDFEVPSNTKDIDILTLVNTTDAVERLKIPNISFNIVVEKPHVGDLTDIFSLGYNNTIPINYVATNNIFTTLNISNNPLNDTIYNSNIISNYEFGQIPTISTPLNSNFSVIDPSFHLKDFEVSSNIKGIALLTFDSRTDNIEILNQPNISVNVVGRKPHLVGDLTDNLTFSYSNINYMNDFTTNIIFPVINIQTQALTDIIYNPSSIPKEDAGHIPTLSSPVNSSFSVIDPSFHHTDFKVSSNTKGIEILNLVNTTDVSERLKKPNISVNVVVEKPPVGDLTNNLSYSYSDTIPMNYVTTNHIFPALNISNYLLTNTIYNSNSIPNYDIGQIPTQSTPLDSSFSIIYPNFNHQDFEVSSNTKGIEIFTKFSTADAIEILKKPNISVNVVIEKPHVGDLTDSFSYSYSNNIPMNYVNTNHTFTSLNIGLIPTKSTPLDSSFSVINPSLHLKDFEVSSNVKGIELFTFDTKKDAIEILNQPNINVNVFLNKPHLLSDVNDNSTYSHNNINSINDVTTENNVTTNRIFPVINIQSHPLNYTIYNINSIYNYDIGRIPTQSNPFDNSFPIIDPNFKEFETNSNTIGIDLPTFEIKTDVIDILNKPNIFVNAIVEKPHVVEDFNLKLAYSSNNTDPKHNVTANEIFPTIHILDNRLTATVQYSNSIPNYDVKQIHSPSNTFDSNFLNTHLSFHHKDFEVSSNTRGMEIFTLVSTTDNIERLNQSNISVNLVVEKPHLNDLTDNLFYSYSSTIPMNYVTTNNIFTAINISDYPLANTIYNTNNISNYDIGPIPTQNRPFNSSFSVIDPSFQLKDFEVSSNTKGIEIFPLVNTTDAIERLKQSNMSAQIFVEKPHIVGNLTDNLSYISNYVTTNRIFPAIDIPVHPLYDTIYNTNSISNYDIGQIPTQINPLDIDTNFHHKDFEISSNISGIELITFVNTTEKLKIEFDNINYKDKQYPSVLVNYVNTFVTEPPIIENPIPEFNYTFFEINNSYSKIFTDHIQNSYNISTPVYIKESLANETRLHYNGSIYVDEGKVTKNIISAEAINIISEHNVSPLPVINIITSISNTTKFVKHNTEIPKPLINYSYFDSHTYSGSYTTTQTNNKIDLPFYAVNQTKFVLNYPDLEHNLKIKMALPFIESNSEKINTQINDVANKHNMSRDNFQSLNKSEKSIKLSGFDNNNIQVSNVSDNLNLQIYGYVHEINKTQSSKHLNYSITSTAHHQKPNISEKSMKVLNYLGNYIANHAESNKLSNSLLKSGQRLKQGFNSHMVKEFQENHKSNENSKYLHNSVFKPKASSLFTNFSSIQFQNNHTKPSIFTLLNMNHLNYSHHHVNHVNNIYQNINHINYTHQNINHINNAYQNINHINYDHDDINHESYAHKNMNHDGINHESYTHQNMNHDGLNHESYTHQNMSHDGINHESYAQQNINHISYGHQNINHINYAHQNMKNINFDHDVMNHEIYAQHNMNQTNYAYQNIQNLKSVGMVDKMIINNTLYKTMLQESSRGSKSNLLNSLKSSSNNILNQGSEGNLNIWSNVNTHPNASHNASPVSIIVIDKGIHVHNIDSNNNKQSSNKNNIFSKELDYQSIKRHKKRKILNKERKFMIPLPKIKKKHKKRKMKFFKLG